MDTKQLAGFPNEAKDRLKSYLERANQDMADFTKIRAKDTTKDFSKMTLADFPMKPVAHAVKLAVNFMKLEQVVENRRGAA